MPLRIEIEFSKIEVLLGQQDIDMILRYNMHIGFNVDGGRELLYDEITMVTALDLESKNDVLFIKVINNKISSTNSERKKMPLRNSMNITEADYREFMSTMGFTTNYMKKWLNEVVFRPGLKMPFKMDELETEIQFQDKSLHIMLAVKEDAARYFEKTYWASDKDFDFNAKN